MLTSFILPVIFAIFYGATMKVADLLDEHGLKWFRGANILFGIFWGGFGALIILSNNVLANIYLAMILAFVLRRKIDYFNHGIAVTIMFFTFLATQTVSWKVLLVFFFIFALFGLMTDYFEDRKKPSNFLLKICRTFIDLRAQYYLFPFLYSLMTRIWIVFAVVAVNMCSYEIMLRIGNRLVKHQETKNPLNS